jgi:Arc/MetJ-type ribon-helix-helix transcriptional regulator
MPHPIDLPEDVARYAEAQVAAGRFASIEAVLSAGVEALRGLEAAEQEWLPYAREAWDKGIDSLKSQGPVLTTDKEFDAFLDDCVHGDEP